MICDECIHSNECTGRYSNEEMIKKEQVVCTDYKPKEEVVPSHTHAIFKSCFLTKN